MNSFQKLVQQDMRLVTLMVLNGDAGYSHNEHVLRGALKMAGHSVSIDKLRTELYWLEEQGLVKTNTTEDLVVVGLTARGKDVATGDAVVPGVKRPEPTI